MYLIDYIEDYFAAAQAARRSASASYHSLAKNLALWMDAQGLRLEVSDLTPELVDQYQQWLKEQDYKASTWSFYMRNLRVVGRRAMEEGLVKADLGFERYELKTRFKEEEREVEWLTDEQLARLRALDVKESRIALARDMLLLGLYLNGMSDTQLVRLMKEDLVGTRLAYTSVVTGQRGFIRLMPEAVALIDRYKSGPDSPYLLSVVNAEDGMGVAERKAVNRLRTATLKLQQTVGFAVRASMARTTWLLKALELKVDSLTICEAMQMELPTYIQIVRSLSSTYNVATEVDMAHRLVGHTLR